MYLNFKYPFSQSSLYYYRIKNVKIYSSNALDITTQLTQRSIESFVTGDFVMTPDLGINPRPGEFFAFQDDVSPELSEHLFQITDVQFDKATSSKYFRCSFKLYPNNTDYFTFAKDGFYAKNGAIFQYSLHCEKCSDKNNFRKYALYFNIYQGKCVFYR